MKEFVRDGKAGESPGKRGRKFKIGPELLDAAAAKQALSQARGVMVGYNCMLHPQPPIGERARGMALDFRRAAITEQGTWGAATGPVV